MTTDTILKLSQINLDFYNRIGPLWNQNSGYFWLGWLKLLPFLRSIKKPNNVLRVLDLGAGNCRFLNFLLTELDFEIEYLGIDFSQEMLNKKELLTTKKLKKIKTLELDLLKVDLKEFLITNRLTTSFDLIIAFGLFHHIPSYKLRQKIFLNIKSLLAPQSKFIFTTWNFLEVPRLKKRIAWGKDLKDDYALQIFGLKREEMEDGDYLLDWIKKDLGYRYAHFFQQQEIDRLLFKSFVLEDSFYADGKEKNRNRYFVTKLADSFNN